MKLFKSIHNNDIKSWQIYKNVKNQFTRIMKKANENFFTARLNDPKKADIEMKKLAGGDSTSVPEMIIKDGKSITSPEELGENMNNFFNSKIKEIKKTIPTTMEDPIDLLKKLVPANENRFHLKEISIQRTYEIIDKMKTSNTTGFDASSGIWGYLTHLSNFPASDILHSLKFLC